MRVLAVAVLLALGLACAGGDDITGDRRTVGSVTVTFTVDPAMVEVGESVQFRIRLVNSAGATEELTFPTGQKYDFWVTSEGSEVWRWSDEMVFTQAITEASVEPQSVQVYSESFVADASGSFIVHGVFLADGYENEMTGELIVG